MRSGTFQIRFAYRTSLKAAGKLRPGKSSTTLEWTGPSFADGIDSARVVFRLPRAATPPRLASSRPGSDAMSVADDEGGVFLSTFRRAADKDELSIVRPHMARGEAVSWRIAVDAGTFDLGAEPHEESVAIPAKVAAPAAPRSTPSWSKVALIAFALALLLAAVVAMKASWVEASCRSRGAKPRPLLPISTPLRAVLAAAGMLGATATIVTSLSPLLAAASLMVALAAATHLPPRVSPALRGPGKWIRLDVEAAFGGPAKPSALPGRFVDAGALPGFVLFTSLLVGFVAAAILVMHRSSYQGLALALGSAILFPIFCTGRAGELPSDPARAPRELLEWLMGELDVGSSCDVYPLGRVPQGMSAHDELRLLVAPRRSRAGFVAIEVGLDFHVGILGLLALPFVIVRVLDGSPAADVLPKGFLWTRGRSADERVTVLRPKLPARELTAHLVRDIADRLSAPRDASARRQVGPTSSARSAGNAQPTSKPGTTSSPAHAT